MPSLPFFEQYFGSVVKWRPDRGCTSDFWDPDGTWRIKPPSVGKPLPEGFEAPTEPTTVQGNDGIGAVDGPVHARPFETGPNGYLAAGLDHSGRHTQFLFSELGIAHPVTVGFEVAETEPGSFDAWGMDGELFEQVVEVSLVQLVVAILGPGTGFGALGPEDFLGRLAQMLLGMEEVNDLDGIGEVFRREVPDPEGSVSDDHATFSFHEPASLGLPIDPPGEVGRGAPGGRGTFDGGRIGDGVRIPDRADLRVGDGGAEEGAELDLSRFGRAIRLLAGPSFQLLFSHGEAGSVQAHVEGGGNWSRIGGDLLRLLSGDLFTQTLRRSLHLLGTYPKSGELRQERGPLLEADHGSDDTDHPNHAGRERRPLQSPGPIVGKEAALAERADDIGPGEGQRPQNRPDGFGEASGTVEHSAAGAALRPRFLLRVQGPFEHGSGNLDRPAANCRFEGFNVHKPLVLTGSQKGIELMLDFGPKLLLNGFFLPLRQSLLFPEGSSTDRSVR